MSEFQFKNVLSNDNNIFYDISRHTDYFVTHLFKTIILDCRNISYVLFLFFLKLDFLVFTFIIDFQHFVGI